MNDEVFLGIDLGTTTTLIARSLDGPDSISVKVLPIHQKDQQGPVELFYLPSVAYFPPNGAPLVGLEAQIRGPEEDASRYVRAVKRQMGRRFLLPVVEREPYEISSLYLAYSLREGRYNLPMGEMVFTATVPASFTTNQRADTLLALRKACEDVHLRYPQEDEGQLFISEPVAAMLAFLNQEFARPEAVRRLDLAKTNRVVVYDIGGGTLDLTLVYIEPNSMSVKTLADLSIHVDAIGYYNPFGGEDFDLALAQEFHRRLLQQFPELESVTLNSAQRLGVRLQLMNAAKQVKEKLGEQMGQQDVLSFLDEGQDPSYYYRVPIRLQGKSYSLGGEITGSEYLRVIQDLRQNSSRKSLVTPLRDLLRKTDLDSARLDGLLIVGGMGRLPIVEETLREAWEGNNIWVFDPPDHAVVAGAAIYSYLRCRYPGFSLQEPAADAYYVRLKDRFDLVLPSKEKRGERKRYELDSDSDRVRLQIFAGEEPEFGKPVETIYPTLIHQGGTTIRLGKEYPKGTPVWVQMVYESESGQDHTKVPWVYVWVQNSEGAPRFRRRYSEIVEEARHE